MNNLKRAKELLKSCGYTCVCCSDKGTLTSKKRGVAPLLSWFEKGKDLHEYSATDKVVGKGAAFLYIMLKIKELHANVISRSALEILTKYHIPVTYDVLTEVIRNRDNTGFCPIETAVLEITDPDTAISVIRETLKQIKKS